MDVAGGEAPVTVAIFVPNDFSLPTARTGMMGRCIIQ